MNPTRAFRPRIVLARNQLCRRHTYALCRRRENRPLQVWCSVTEKSAPTRVPTMSDVLRAKKNTRFVKLFYGRPCRPNTHTHTHGPNEAVDFGRSRHRAKCTWIVSSGSGLLGKRVLSMNVTPRRFSVSCTIPFRSFRPGFYFGPRWPKRL